MRLVHARVPTGPDGGAYREEGKRVQKGKGPYTGASIPPKANDAKLPPISISAPRLPFPLLFSFPPFPFTPKPFPFAFLFPSLKSS